MVVFGPVDSDSFVVAKTNDAHGAPKAVTCRHTEVFRRQDVDAFEAYFCCYLAEGVQWHLLVGPAYDRLPNPIFGICRVIFLQKPLLLFVVGKRKTPHPIVVRSL